MEKNFVEKPNQSTNPLSFMNFYQKMLKEHISATIETNLDAEECRLLGCGAV
jgi:hypothetical protein